METQPQEVKKSQKGLIALLVSAPLVLGALAYWLYFITHFVYTNDALVDSYRMDLGPDILRRVVALYADDGDIVEENQLLAQFQADIHDAEKEAAVAKVWVMEEEVRLQEVMMEKAKNDYSRAAQGYEERIIPFEKYDHMHKDYGIANFRYQKAIKDLELAKKELDVIEAKLFHTKVFAPRRGIVSKRWGMTGDVLQPGEVLFTVYDLETVWILVNLNEKKIQHVKVGSPATVTIDAYPGWKFTGHVYVIKGAAASEFSLIPQDNATGNYTKVAQRIPMRVTIEKPKDWPEDKPLYLFPGMSAEVKIKIR